MSQHDRPWRQNDGRKPRAPPETLVEVQFRNGQISRPAPLDSWKRWDAWPWGESAFDIMRSRRA